MVDAVGAIEGKTKAEITRRKQKLGNQKLEISKANAKTLK